MPFPGGFFNNKKKNAGEDEGERARVRERQRERKRKRKRGKRIQELLSILLKWKGLIIKKVQLKLEVVKNKEHVK